MANLPDDALEEVVLLLLKHSDLPGPHELSLSRPDDLAKIESLDDDVNLMESALRLFKTSLQERMTGIRRRRNLLLPVYRLPPEILGIIFGKVQDAHENGKLKYEALRGMAGVSYHWFSTILSSPRLWVIIDSKCRPSLIKSILKRSKDVQLHIQLSGGGMKMADADILQLLMPHVARWQTLDISSYIFSDLLRRMGNVQSMPKLLSFRVSAMYNGSRVPEFIQSRAPRVQSLSIVPFSFPLGAPVLTSLRSLEFSPVAEGVQLSSHQWRTLLCSSSQLECIKAVGPQQFQWRDKHFHQFHALLPNLQKIVLCLIPPSIIGGLLSSLFLAKGTSPCVELQNAAEIRGSSRVVDLFPPSPLPQSLSWLIRGMKWMTARIHTPHLFIEAGMQPGVCNLGLREYISSVLPSNMLVALISTNGLLSLDSLLLDGAEFFQGDGFIWTLSCIPKLIKLDIRHPNGSNDTNDYPNNLDKLCDALSSPFSTGAGKKASWLLPDLRNLGIASEDACRSVLPLIEARYGLSTMSQMNELPIFLEVLRLQNLSRSEEIAPDSVLVSRLHEILDKRGTKLEISAHRKIDEDAL